MIDSSIRHLPGVAFAARLLCALLLACFVRAALAGDNAQEVAIRVEVQEGVVRVDAEVLIPASRQEVWDVLTDFDHLSRFVSNIRESRIVGREGNVLRVAQAGQAGFGPFSFRFRSEREFTLTPTERFESRQITGNMKRYLGVTQLESVAAGTRIRFHSEAVPDTVLPVGLGRSLIESETREHYEEIRREVLRRKGH